MRSLTRAWSRAVLSGAFVPCAVWQTSRRPLSHSPSSGSPPHQSDVALPNATRAASATTAVTMAPPSAHEIHQVVQRAVEQGRQEHATALFLGALRLRCVPLAETYELLLSSIIHHQGWRAAVDLIDELGLSALSMRWLYHTVADMCLLRIQASRRDGDEEEAQALLHDLHAFMGEAAARRVALASRHRVPVWEALLSDDTQAPQIIHFYKAHMVSAGVTVSTPELATLLRAAAVSGDWACATLLYRQWPADAPAAEAQVLYVQSFTRALEEQAEQVEAAPATAALPVIPWQEAVEMLVCGVASDAQQRGGRSARAGLPARLLDALKELENTARAQRPPVPPSPPYSSSDPATHVDTEPVTAASSDISAVAAVVAQWLSPETIERPAPSRSELRDQIVTAANAAVVLGLLGSHRDLGHMQADVLTPPQRTRSERAVALLCRVWAAFPALYTVASAQAAQRLAHQLRFDWLPQPWAPVRLSETSTPLWRVVLKTWQQELDEQEEGSLVLYRSFVPLYLTHHAWLSASSADLAAEASAAHREAMKVCTAKGWCLPSAEAGLALLRAVATTATSVPDDVNTLLTPLLSHIAQADPRPRAADVLDVLLEAAAACDDQRRALSPLPPAREDVSHALRLVAVAHVLSARASQDGTAGDAESQSMTHTLGAALLASQDVEAALALVMPVRAETMAALHAVVVPLLVRSEQWARLEPLLETSLLLTTTEDVSRIRSESVAMQRAGDAQLLLRRSRLFATRAALESALGATRDDDATGKNATPVLDAWRAYRQACDGAPTVTAPLPLSAFVRVGVCLAVSDHVADLTRLLDMTNAIVARDRAVAVEASTVCALEGLRLYVSLRSSSGGSGSEEGRGTVAVASALTKCQSDCPRLIVPDALVVLSSLAALALSRRDPTTTTTKPAQDSASAALAVLASAAQNVVVWEQRYAHHAPGTPTATVDAVPTMPLTSVHALSHLADVFIALLPLFSAATWREEAESGDSRRRTGQSTSASLIAFYVPTALASTTALVVWVDFLEGLQLQSQKRSSHSRRRAGRHSHAAGDGRVCAVAARLAWRLFTLVSSSLDTEVVPWRTLLVLMEVCTRQAAHTRVQWQQIRGALATLATRPAPTADGDALQARLDALLATAMSSLAELGAWKEALACLPLRHAPLTVATATSTSSVGDAPAFTADAALACTLQLSEAQRLANEEVSAMREEARAGLGVGAVAAVVRAPRDLVERLVSLGAWEESLELLGIVLAFRARADEVFVRAEAQALAARQRAPQPHTVWSLRNIEACVEVGLIARVMALVCARAPWRTSWRAWMRVRAALPYVDWPTVGPACEATVSALLASMDAQGAEPHEILDVVVALAAEWGLTVRLAWLRIVVAALHRRPSPVTAAESVLCVARLRALQHQSTERHVAALVGAIVTEYFGVDPVELMAPAAWPQGPAAGALSSSPSSSSALARLPLSTAEPPAESVTAGQSEAEVDARTLDVLTLLAPLIVLATPHQLYVLTKMHLAHTALHPMQLRPLLRRHGALVRQRLASLNAATPTQDWLVDQLTQQHTFVVSLAGLLSEGALRATTLLPGASLSHVVQRELFDGFIALATAQALVDRTLVSAQALQRCRWSPLVEEELRTAVLTQHTGRPPASLRTAPKLAKAAIAHYWSLYHPLLAPELHLDGSELCCLAAYAPHVAAMRVDATLTEPQREAAMRELTAAVQAVHMTASPGQLDAIVSLPATPWRRPAYVVAILYAHSLKLLTRLSQELPSSPSGSTPALPGLPSVVQPVSDKAGAAEAEAEAPRSPRTLLARLLGSPPQDYPRIAAHASEGLRQRLPAPSTATRSLTSAVSVDAVLSALTTVILSYVRVGQPVPDAASLALLEAVKQAGAVRCDPVAVHLSTEPDTSLLKLLPKAQRDRLHDDASNVRLDASALRRTVLWRVWAALDSADAWRLMQPTHVLAMQRVVAPSEAAVAELPIRSARQKRQQTDAAVKTKPTRAGGRRE